MEGREGQIEREEGSEEHKNIYVFIFTFALNKNWSTSDDHYGRLTFWGEVVPKDFVVDKVLECKEVTGNDGGQVASLINRCRLLRVRK